MTDPSTKPPIQAAPTASPPSVLTAEVAPTDEPLTAAALPAADDRPPAHWLVRTYRRLASAGEWLFGLASLLGGLALLASFPLLQFLSLGYLLEAAGRPIRTGRWRDGWVGIRQAAKVGGLVLHTWIVLLPLRLVSDLWYDAQLIDPLSGTTEGWRRGQLVLVGLTLTHVVSAWFCGGTRRYFYWPVLFPWYGIQTLAGWLSWSDWFPPARLWRSAGAGGLYVQARDGVWDYLNSLRLPYYAWLGVRGFVGALLWLAIPGLLLIGGRSLPPGPATLSGLAGGVALIVVVLYLPFLQARFAAEGRSGALWEVGAVRERFRRAPIAFWLALLLTLALPLPLYLLQLIPFRDVPWLPALVFAASILPARLSVGWALLRAERRETPRHWAFLWGARLLAVPAAAFYVWMVYLAQFATWYGSPFEQPAFLMPAPAWIQ